MSGELLQRETTDYSNIPKSLEVHSTMLEEHDKVLLADDGVETETQMRAAAHLVEEAAASVTGIIAVRIHRIQKTASLFEQYTVHSLDQA